MTAVEPPTPFIYKNARRPFAHFGKQNDMSKDNDTYLKALLWTCQTCGFVKEGDQPHMECPICESYKANFIDIPQDIEQRVRAEHPDKNPNNRVCREMRLKLMKEENAAETNRYSGRVLPTESGNHMDPSK